MPASDPSKSAYKTELAQILAAQPQPGANPHRLFHGVGDDMWFWANTQGYRDTTALQQILPRMPAEAIQARFTGRSGDATIREAFLAYQLFRESYERYAAPLTGNEKILDFGCGWGRIIRLFLRDAEPANIWGIDCLDEAISTATDTNHWSQFKLVDPMPPTDFPDETFDLVYCFSVFSHLSEDAHLRWVREFQRLLRPGGIFIATTRPREFIEYCGEVRKWKEIPSWALGTAKAFPNTDHWLKLYDQGKLCYFATGGGGTLDESFYGETCIPKEYVVANWAPYFTFRDFVTDRSRCEQNVIVVQKP